MGEVCNFDVALDFAQQLQEFSASHRNTQPEIVYHWTKKENLNSILEHNLRRAGDVNGNGSQIAQAHGAVHGKGIYAADNINFGRSYGKGAPALCSALRYQGARWRATFLMTTTIPLS